MYFFDFPFAVLVCPKIATYDYRCSPRTFSLLNAKIADDIVIL